MSFLTNLSKIFKAPSPAREKRKVVKTRKVKVYHGRKAVISRQQIEEAKTRAREIILEAKDEAFKIKTRT
ncbi:unnamed protein product, partial [marine sediment metagenome]